MTLTPGRELDARVAEAMGWTQCDPLYRSDRWEFTDPPDDPVIVGIGTQPPPLSCRRPIPHYSTDIAAAMAEPWEWLKAQKDEMALEKHDDVFYCHAFSQWEFDVGPFKTEALAICAAVLAAKEDTWSLRSAASS